MTVASNQTKLPTINYFQCTSLICKSDGSLSEIQRMSCTAYIITAYNLYGNHDWLCADLYIVNRGMAFGIVSVHVS